MQSEDASSISYWSDHISKREIFIGEDGPENYNAKVMQMRTGHYSDYYTDMHQSFGSGWSRVFENKLGSGSAYLNAKVNTGLNKLEPNPVRIRL